MILELVTIEATLSEVNQDNIERMKGVSSRHVHDSQLPSKIGSGLVKQ